MSLPRCLLIVDAHIDPEVEADWNAWYDTVHLPEILACPGVLSGARYRASGEAGHYVAVYELAGPEALESEMFNARRGWGRFRDHVRFTTTCFEQWTPEAGGGR